MSDTQNIALLLIAVLEATYQELHKIAKKEISDESFNLVIEEMMSIKEQILKIRMEIEK